MDSVEFFHNKPLTFEWHCLTPSPPLLTPNFPAWPQGLPTPTQGVFRRCNISVKITIVMAIVTVIVNEDKTSFNVSDGNSTVTSTVEATRSGWPQTQSQARAVIFVVGNPVHLSSVGPQTFTLKCDIIYYHLLCSARSDHITRRSKSVHFSNQIGKGPESRRGVTWLVAVGPVGGWVWCCLANTAGGSERVEWEEEALEAGGGGGKRRRDWSEAEDILPGCATGCLDEASNPHQLD